MGSTWFNCLVLTGLVLIGTTSAKPLTFSDAIARAHNNNRALAAQKLKIDAAKERIHQAGALPNPEIAAGIEGIKADEVEVTVAHTFEPAKKRYARKQAAKAAVAPLEAQYDILSLTLTAGVTRTFCTLLSLRNKLVIVDSLIVASETVRDAIRDRLDAGAAMRVDLLRATMSITSLKNTRNNLKHTEQRLLLSLKKLLGDTSSLPVSVTGTLRHDVPAPDTAFCAARIQEHPSWHYYNKQLSVDKARLHRAQTDWLPDITVTAGYLRNNEQGQNKPVLGAEMTLPIFNRNRGEVKAIVKEQQSVEAEASQAHISRMTAARQLLLRIAECDTRIRVLENELIPTEETIYKELITMYTNGRVSFIEVTEAQTDLLGYRTGLIDLQLERLLYFADLEEQCGTTFSIIH